VNFEFVLYQSLELKLVLDVLKDGCENLLEHIKNSVKRELFFPG